MRSLAAKLVVTTVLAGAALWGSNGIALAGGGCHTPPTASEGDTVEMANLCFVSTVLHAEPGTEITWNNVDSVTHDVVGVGDTWGDAGISILPGHDVSYRFDEEGVYPYACWIHPGMVGAVVIGDGVGKDLTAVVPVAAGGEEAGSNDVATSPLVQDDGNDATALWIVGTALVVGALAGAFAVAMRNRRKVTVPG